MTPDPLNRLVAQLAKLPGIGEKTAQRLAFHILRAPGEYAQELSLAIREVKEKVHLCVRCFSLTEFDGVRWLADKRFRLNLLVSASEELMKEDSRYKHARDSSKSIMEKAEKIPMVKQIVEFFFGEVTSASASTKVQKFRSEEESRISNELYLVCNTASESWGEKIKDTICDIANSVIGKGVPGC